MNLTATLCQTRSPAFFTFYKQNNNKNDNCLGAGQSVVRRKHVMIKLLYMLCVCDRKFQSADKLLCSNGFVVNTLFNYLANYIEMKNKFGNHFTDDQIKGLMLEFDGENKAFEIVTR